MCPASSSSARVISQAGNPVSPSSPRKALVLGLSLVLGLFAGSAAGALREFRERFFRTGDDVREALDMDFLGYLPAVGRQFSRKAKAKAAYGAFLMLWKDADPDIPILKSVKAEYAKL